MLEVTFRRGRNLLPSSRVVFVLTTLNSCVCASDRRGLLRNAPGGGPALPTPQLHGPNQRLPLSHQIHVHWR